MSRTKNRLCDRPIDDLATHQAQNVTVDVVSRYLDCDARTVRKMIDAGVLHAFRVGQRELRITIESLRAHRHAAAPGETVSR